MPSQNDGVMIVLSSPSGAGKTTLVKMLSKVDNYEISISHTTRQPRPSEINDKDYYFVKEDEFKRLINNQEFLEYAKVFNNFYGTTRTPVIDKLNKGKNILYDIDWQGADQIKNKKLDYKLITFFILPPSREVLFKRLSNRDMKDKLIAEERMKQFDRDVLHWINYDYVVINENLEKYKSKYGSNIPFELHSKIRSEEACLKSTKKIIKLAKETNARLHVFHLSTKSESLLFDNSMPLKDKKITSEVCVHHLWFSDNDYKNKQSLIKWNPSIKTSEDRSGIWDALLNDKIDVIATDHAPHTIEEKSKSYLECPSGGPLVQHALVSMIEHHFNNKISLEKIVTKMCHNPAILFQIKNRGFIRKGYFADLVLVNLNKSWTVNKQNILYKCNWSPFEGQKFNSQVTHTFVNGNLAYNKGGFSDELYGEKILFDR